MKAVGGSNIKFLMRKHRDERVLFWSREIVLSRRERGSASHQRRVSNGLFLAQKPVLSISASSSNQTNDETKETQTMHLEDQQKTVHVRMKLHKECAFGQQFLVVGDDPTVGLWDPSNGVPLTWSEGHVWTAEIDIPSGKEIKYKFILKGVGESITWQPGPDRILKTWLTDKAITLYEDWEKPELQTAVEEEFEAEIQDESVPDTKIGENLNLLMSDEENAVINEPPDGNNNDSSDLLDPLYIPKIGENISEGFEGLDICANEKGKSYSSENGEREAREDNHSFISKDEETSLVLGLMEKLEEGEIDEGEKDGNVEKRVDEVEDSAEAETEEEHVHAPMLQETSETALNIDRQLQTDGSDPILDGLQKFLSNLGFR